MIDWERLNLDPLDPKPPRLWLHLLVAATMIGATVIFLWIT